MDGDAGLGFFNCRARVEYWSLAPRRGARTWLEFLGVAASPCGELGDAAVSCRELGDAAVSCRELGDAAVSCRELGSAEPVLRGTVDIAEPVLRGTVDNAEPVLRSMFVDAELVLRTRGQETLKPADKRWKP